MSYYDISYSRGGQEPMLMEMIRCMYCIVSILCGLAQVHYYLIMSYGTDVQDDVLLKRCSYGLAMLASLRAHCLKFSQISTRQARQIVELTERS